MRSQIQITIISVRLRTVNWLKYNPFNETYYFYVNGASDDMGLYSFTESFEPHNSLAGVSQNVALCTQFTKISSFSGIPGGAKMTIPVRIAYGTWMSYDSNGNAYFTSDLITWKTLADYDAGSADISGAKLFNEDSNQKRFYLDASNTLKSIDTGFVREYLSTDKLKIKHRLAITSGRV